MAQKGTLSNSLTGESKFGVFDFGNSVLNATRHSAPNSVLISDVERHISPIKRSKPKFSCGFSSRHSSFLPSLVKIVLYLAKLYTTSAHIHVPPWKYNTRREAYGWFSAHPSYDAKQGGSQRLSDMRQPNNRQHWRVTWLTIVHLTSPVLVLYIKHTLQVCYLLAFQSQFTARMVVQHCCISRCQSNGEGGFLTRYDSAQLMLTKLDAWSCSLSNKKAVLSQGIRAMPL